MKFPYSSNFVNFAANLQERLIMEKQTTPFAPLAYIDALRGLAILGVLMVHCSINGLRHYPDWVGEIFYEGARGVQLFYVVSAFTLFLSFHHRKKEEKYPIRNFFVRRFFRIAPMYYVAIAYFLWQDGLGPRGWLGDAQSISPLNILSNTLFLHGLSPYWINSLVPGGWSVGVEMLFYLMLPFLFPIITNLNRAMIFTLATLAIKIVLHYFLYKHHLIGHAWLWTNYLYLYFPSQLPIFGFGMMAYFILMKKDYQFDKWLIPIFLLLLNVQYYTSKPEFRHLGISLYGVLFLGLVILLAHRPYKLIVNPLFIYLGKVSYSAYLINWGVLYWIVTQKAKFNLLDFFKSPLGIYPYLNFFTRLAVTTLIVMLIATVLWKVIEQPFQRLGKKWIESWENKDKMLTEKTEQIGKPTA
ncbi:MAG: acyltransferase family protein [Bacteroidia bacterium]